MIILARHVLFFGLVMILSTKAYSAGTTADTTITNEVFVDFSVSGVAQTQVSDSVNFKVDRVVAFTVTSNGNLNVVGNATGQVLQYTINHVGNYVGDFSLAALNDAGDDFNPSATALFVEDGTTPGYQAMEDTETFVDELAADASIVVYVVSTIPGSVADGDTSIVHMQATAREGGTATVQGAVITQTAGADTAGSVDTVLNDGVGSASGDAARDGLHSDDGTYTVVSANLVVTKSSAVISDPVNGVSVNAKRIPGAVIEYTISIENTGSVTADDLVISDQLDANTTYSAGTIVVDGVAEDDNAMGADETDPNGANFSVDTVTATIDSLANGATKEVVFRVTID